MRTKLKYTPFYSVRAYFVNMLPLPPFPTQLASNKLFPHPEGEQWEYKAATLETTKLYKTICAFLNARGGYIVIGVTDDLRCIGVHKDAKKYDTLARSIDNIWHCSNILEESSGKLPLTTTITLEQKELGGVLLLVITIVPESGKRYKLSNGEFWMRLNASNYCVPESKVYEHHTVLKMIAQKEADIAAKAQQAEVRITTSYTQMLRSVQRDLAEYREEVAALRQLLEHSIVQQKEKKERDMSAHRAKGFVQWVWQTLVEGCF